MTERGPHFEMVTFSIDPNTLHELRALAREQGLPLARLLRKLVQIGLEVHKCRITQEVAQSGDAINIGKADVK